MRRVSPGTVLGGVEVVLSAGGLATAGDRTVRVVPVARTISAPGGTAASGQPPRESYSHAFCWTTSFPALAATLCQGGPAGKRVIRAAAGPRCHRPRAGASLGP